MGAGAMSGAGQAQQIAATDREEPFNQRLRRAREEVKQEETPVPGTEPGQTPRPQRVSSDTYISVARASG